MFMEEADMTSRETKEVEYDKNALSLIQEDGDGSSDSLDENEK